MVAPGKRLASKAPTRPPCENYLKPTLVKRFAFMLPLLRPLIWPRQKYRLQLLIILSGLTVILGCAVNINAVIYAQKIVDSMTRTPIETEVGIASNQDFRWDLILVFIGLKIFQGVGALSLLTCLQQIMWIPIEHHARHEIQVKFFKHLHSMSLNWAITTKTGDILGALERGTESIASTLEHLIYSVFPTIADIIIAMAYLSFKFGWIYGTIVGTQILSYLVITAYIIERRSKYQSSINEAENDLSQKVMESLLNFETVKCFGNEDFEKDKYSRSLRSLQYRQRLVAFTSSILQSAQLVIINGGLLACSLLLVSTIATNKHLTPGDYVLCTSYLAQLYGPLNYLGGYYRELRVNLINAEFMLEYFNEKPEITNSENAYDLKVMDGSIVFEDVCYTSESGERVLDQVTFTVRPKTTVALVGTSGSGKTSIIRLLLRLMDATSGKIFIDEADIKEVTLESLRSSIGIVPQDTILFNDSIRNNIKYGNTTASDYEVATAASAAEIHDRIMSFPAGYETMVGERGTLLSGGERQRVAISRALLKGPKILVLDEATSALDAKTEKEIYESLRYLCRDRTCLMITHRLAPAAEADCIIVLQNGKIIEKGSHLKLLERNGVYKSMWEQQYKSTSERTSIFHNALDDNRIL